MTVYVGIVIVAFLGPYLAITLEVDPLYYFMKDILGPFYRNYKYLEIFICLVRIVYITIYVLDAAKFIGWVFTLTFLAQRFVVICLRNIEVLTSRKKLKKLHCISQFSGFHYYQSLRIIRDLSGYASDAAALFAMAGGGVCIILSNFTTVKLHHAIPLPHFLFFPCMSILCPIFGSSALKVGSQAYEISKSFKRKWLNALNHNYDRWKGTGNSKYWTRKCSILVPVPFNVGVNDFILCRIDRETSPHYWYEILYYSVTAILSIRT